MIDAERANIMKLTSTRVAALALVLAGAVICGWGVVIAQQPASRSHTPVSKQQIEKWKNELSNWGRWGKDDERGALNLITPAKRKQAAALVKEGFTVSLAGDADTVKAIDNPNPYDHKMLGIGSDYIGVAAHGWAHTHLDSLAEAARYRRARQRSSAGCQPVEDRDAECRARFLACDTRRPAARQLRPRGAGASRSDTEPLGIHADRGAVAGPWRDRVAGESDRGVLRIQSGQRER